MLRINDLKLELNENENNLDCIIAKKLKISKDDISNVTIRKKSLDARKDPIVFIYTVDFNIKDSLRVKVMLNKIVSVSNHKTYTFDEHNASKDTKIAIIGYGPSAMFSALNLSEHGYCNITIYERGEAIDQRDETVDKLHFNGILDPESNIQFGEGGAGTYSDGKLTSRSKDLRSHLVMKYFIDHGAHSSIAYEKYPHLGSDMLKIYTKNITNTLKQRGVSFKFRSKLNDFETERNKITKILINDEWISGFDHIIIAVGHSSRDTFEMLVNRNVDVTQKSFAVGMRVEHPQVLIDKQMFKNNYSNKKLDRASYRVTAKTCFDKSVYSFCMCPGGFVVNASSEPNLLCTNGMSNYERDEVNANSAILINVDTSDFGDDMKAGLNFQRELEKKAFILGGSDYQAPAQNVIDYINNKASTALVITPSFPNGVKCANLRQLFDEKITNSIIEALNHFEKIIPGFIEFGVFTAIETRSSSPLRFMRNKLGYSESHINLYPTGEGAGYAGGIVSSAIDGIKQAENIMRRI